MSFRQITKFKRATQFVVALFFGFSLAAQAGKSETYQDLIEKAYRLSLQKDRTQAINLLVSSARHEARRGSPPKEILLALSEVSNVFYTDKAQQLFELGISLRATDPSLSTSKLNEALRLEPDNMQVAIELGRLLLMQNECDAATRSATKMLEKNPFFEEANLLLAQGALCLGRFSEYLQARSQIDEKKRAKDIYWGLLEVEHLFRTGAFERGRDLVSTLTRAFPEMPELHYWKGKFAVESKAPSQVTFEKYLSLCKNSTAKILRNYSAEPRVCRRGPEVEAELKKNPTSGVTK